MPKTYQQYVLSAIKLLDQYLADFGALKKRLCKELRLPMPTNADLREVYEKLVAAKKISRNLAFEKALQTRLVRTQSGVAVVAVLTKPYPCPGECLYCPTEKNMPKSYLSNEPAVMRAIDAQFDPYRQVQNRLRSLELNGHSTDKIELIVMGGTFSYLPKDYQQNFITECFRACNEYGKKLTTNNLQLATKNADTKLNHEQKKNEKAQHRIIGLTLETRPDYIDAAEIANFRTLGCTRVELGVQSIFDDVLTLNKRGHLTESTIRATKMLRDAGFKLNYHMMPGLPGSTLKRDFEMFQILFGKPPASPRSAASPRFEAGDFQPDMLKIYPTVVLKDSKLYALWQQGHYTPLTDQQFKRLALKIKNEAIPPYVRIARLVRDVPTPSIVAGPIISNLRQIIAAQSHCPCIRCREVKGAYTLHEKIVLERINYAAADGQEVFLQFVSPDPPRVDERLRVEAGKQKLFALLRLRLPANNNRDHFISTLRNAALIREVHTYGKLAKISSRDKNSPQHIGLGKKLLLEAERIAREEYDFKKIAVISGVGVRDYYRKNGYRLSQTYLVKKLAPIEINREV